MCDLIWRPACLVNGFGFPPFSNTTSDALVEVIREGNKNQRGRRVIVRL